MIIIESHFVLLIAHEMKIRGYGPIKFEGLVNNPVSALTLFIISFFSFQCI